MTCDVCKRKVDTLWSCDGKEDICDECVDANLRFKDKSAMYLKSGSRRQWLENKVNG